MDHAWEVIVKIKVVSLSGKSFPVRASVCDPAAGAVGRWLSLRLRAACGGSMRRLVVVSLLVIPLLAAAQSQPSTLPELPWHLTARPWEASHFHRTNLLDKVENIVTALAPLQYWNAAAPGDVQDGGDVQNGSIIDPYRLREHQYATPYFTFAVATAVAYGRSTNLCEIGARALDHATADIAGLDGSAQANDSHGEFFGAPMMKAVRLYKQIAAQYPVILTPSRIARWESRLTTSRVSYMNNGVPQNWRTYGMKGEWLRVQDGLIPRTGGAGGQGVDYIENYWLNEQRARYVRDRDVLGQNPYLLTYHDDDPGPKQNFSYMGGATGNLLDMIRNGYDGPSRAEIAAITQFCARTCLLLVSGNGDAPAGGRTGDHVWNDVVYGNTFELAAEMAWSAGDMRRAGQFRRAARLALQSAWRYQQEQGWFSVTKSLLPAAQQNFYADWSALANYNGYTEIHSAEAFTTELSPIPEQPAPAEIGGYAVTLDDQFDNAFINAGGMQVQVCTEGSTAANLAGSLRWHTLGIVRFSRPDWESRLGPGAGWIQADGALAISFAPTFYESNAWQMVSEQPDRFLGTFTPIFTHPLLVRGALTISPKSGQIGPTFNMNLIVTPDGVLVDTTRTAGSESFGITWPVLEFDGKHVMNTQLSSHVAATAYPKMGVTRIIAQAEAAALSGGVISAASQADFTGAGYAAFPTSGGAIEWVGVSGGDGGAATVGFRYTLAQAAAAARTLLLYVNGQPHAVTFEHTGNKSTYGGSVLSFPMVWHQLHLPVTLGAGNTNRIRLEAETAGGLNVDELRVFPAEAAQPEPDQQNFISLDAAPTIDASTPVRRTAYGDQRPVRVSNADNPVTTWVYPRKAADPTAESVRASFVRSGTNFSSALGRVAGDLYVGRTAAGGKGAGLDLDNNGTNDITFSATCEFVLQTSNAIVTALEADRFVTATYRDRELKLAPYTPIEWSDTAALWHNVLVAATGNHFEVQVEFTPSTNQSDEWVGFAGHGASAAADLALALRFGADGKITPGNGTPMALPVYQAGVTYRIRAEFDVIAHRYNLWLKPSGGAEIQLLEDAVLPVAILTAADLDTFAYRGEALAASTPVITLLPELRVSIVSPVTALVTLPSTNVSLQLIGSVSNAPGNIASAWVQNSGPGLISFENSNTRVTTAQFSAEGIYELSFGVTGTAATTNLTVVVANRDHLTTGLASWWKLDELGGGIASDSSGSGRDATVTGGNFVGGKLANAIQFTGAASRASYAAADGNQITVAAWVRCDATGGGSFPRIVNAPGWRLMFRFSSNDPYSIGFASQDGVNGDWDSGGGSIALGNWYHVAASYDRSNLAANKPVFYINGVKYPTITLAQPSGTAATLSGTGYIGNSAALNRNWNGLIDELRVYNRILSEGEILGLAIDPAANLAPIVSAGSNQTGFWPALVNLIGSVDDDGKPNPPGTLTTSWGPVSGPGVVTFGNSNALATTASFSAPGVYQVQLAAADGEVTSISSVTITVIAPPTIKATANAGLLQLSWLAAGSNWQLQVQTNAWGTGVGSNWVTLPNPAGTNLLQLPIDAANGAVFYRLILP